MLINNAGLMPHSSLERRKIDDWNHMIDANLKGVLYGIAAALPHMQQQQAGHIIRYAASIISSINSLQARAATIKLVPRATT